MHHSYSIQAVGGAPSTPFAQNQCSLAKPSTLYHICCPLCSLQPVVCLVRMSLNWAPLNSWSHWIVCYFIHVFLKNVWEQDMTVWLISNKTLLHSFVIAKILLSVLFMYHPSECIADTCMYSFLWITEDIFPPSAALCWPHFAISSPISLPWPVLLSF